MTIASSSPSPKLSWKPGRAASVARHRLGRLRGVDALALDIPRYIASQRFERLSVTVEDVVRAGALPGPHRDPFDRMLIAQAIGHDLVVVSNEAPFDSYGVQRLW